MYYVYIHIYIYVYEALAVKASADPNPIRVMLLSLVSASLGKNFIQRGICWEAFSMQHGFIRDSRGILIRARRC